MALTVNNKIAIWPTAKAACRMLWAARKQHVALAFIAYFPILVIAALDQGSPTAIAILSVFWVLLWLIPMHILWQRLFLVGPDFFLKITAQRLFKMWLRLIGYYLALGLTLAFAALIFFAAWAGLGALWRFAFDIFDPRVATLTGLIATAAFGYFCAIVLMRLALIPVGITVEEHISLRNSWSIVRGNTARLWLMIFLLLFSSTILILIICLVILGLIGVAAWAIAGKDLVHQAMMWPSLQGLLNFLFSPLITAISALQMAALAIIYRDLVPQPEHEVDVIV